MSKVKIQGSASGNGTLIIQAPTTSTDRTITLPDSTGTLATTADVPSSITDNGDATAIKIDSSERVAIGNTDAGNYYSSADNLVVYDATQHAGITIASGGTDKTGNIYFADGTSGDAEYEGYIEYNHNGNAMSIGANHTTKVRIDSDGLKFNSDTASANALHDYEEGTCTMNFKASGSSTLAGSSSATYTKIGKMVTVQGEISGTISSLTQNDSMNLQGLPFTPNGTGSCPIFTRYLETPTDTTNVVGYYNSGAASIEVWFMPNHANYVRAKVQDFHNSSNDIYFTVTYLTNS